MRLIDADELCKNSCSGGICSDCDEMFNGKNASANCSEIRYYFLNIIERQPSVDAVEVVRCKDCKHSEHWYPDKYLCFIWSEVGIGVFYDGFCNYAERKEE